MARGGRRKHAKRETDTDDDSPKTVGARIQAALIGGFVGAAGGAVFAAEWLEDFEYLLPLMVGGGLVTALLGAVMGDKVWETITDWM
jgi:hypothetical protein